MNGCCLVTWCRLSTGLVIRRWMMIRQQHMSSLLPRVTLDWTVHLSLPLGLHIAIMVDGQTSSDMWLEWKRICSSVDKCLYFMLSTTYLYCKVVIFSVCCQLHFLSLLVVSLSLFVFSLTNSVLAVLLILSYSCYIIYWYLYVYSYFYLYDTTINIWLVFCCQCLLKYVNVNVSDFQDECCQS